MAEIDTDCQQQLQRASVQIQKVIPYLEAYLAGEEHARERDPHDLLQIREDVNALRETIRDWDSRYQ